MILIPGQKYSKSLVVTKEMVSQYAKVSGDHNPIHLTREVAVSAGFPDVIVHGMLMMGICTKLFHPLFEEGYTVVTHSTRFISPLLVGGKLVLEGIVDKLGDSIIELKITGVSNKALVFSGTATLSKVPL